MGAFSEYTYVCRRVDSVSEAAWRDIPAVRLIETEKGGDVRLATVMRSCWTGEAVHFRFECEDDHVVANFTKRDEPLYDEDVVEIFIDEQGDGRFYKEFEISPHNVLFDALIENDLAGSIKVDTDWDAPGIRTEVTWLDGTHWVCDVVMPFGMFSTPPKPGLEWRANFYRIDDDRNGQREYAAWSPTGIINYHTPHRFGRFIFS